MDEGKTINYQFKLMYAVAMILVVAGHSCLGGLPLFTEWFGLNGYSLALFFFCSGYFYKPVAENDPIAYIIKKFKSIIVPLYIYNFVYAGIVTLSTFFGFSIGTGVTLRKLLLDPIIDGHQFVYNLGGWCLIPMFMLTVFTVFFRKVLPLKGKTKEWVVFVVYVGLGVLGNALAIRGYNRIGIELVVVRMLHMMPVFGLGMLYKNLLEEYDTVNNFIYFGVIFGIQAAILLYFKKMPSYTASWCNSFTEGPWMPVLYSFLGIGLWLRITRILEPAIGRSKTVLAIANNTFSIMMNHFVGFMVVKMSFYGIGRVFGVMQDFDLHWCLEDIWYYYFPGGVYQIGVLYIIGGLAIPILIQVCINKAKAKLKVG